MGSTRFRNPPALSSVLAALGTLQLRAVGFLNRVDPLVSASNYYVESDIERSTDITRAVRINHFCKHSINVKGQNNTQLLASLSWYKYHPSNSTLGKPITVWYSDLFESFGTHSLVPVHMIKCRSVSSISKLEGESVIFVCPCINYCDYVLCRTILSFA